MKTKEQLEQLTKSIRLTNQAKMLSEENARVSTMIEVLQKHRLRNAFKIKELQTKAHELQKEAIEPTVVEPKQKTKRSITADELIARLGRAKVEDMLQLALKVGLIAQND